MRTAIRPNRLVCLVKTPLVVKRRCGVVDLVLMNNWGLEMNNASCSAGETKAKGTDVQSPVAWLGELAPQSCESSREFSLELGRQRSVGRLPVLVGSEERCPSDGLRVRCWRETLYGGDTRPWGTGRASTCGCAVGEGRSWPEGDAAALELWRCRSGERAGPCGGSDAGRTLSPASRRARLGGLTPSDSCQDRKCSETIAAGLPPL
jgi:hypothetical protein